MGNTPTRASKLFKLPSIFGMRNRIKRISTDYPVLYPHLWLAEAFCGARS